MLLSIRRRLTERRLFRLNQRLEEHCLECPTCTIAAWGNRSQRRQANNPKFCHRAQAILLQLDQVLTELRDTYARQAA